MHASEKFMKTSGRIIFAVVLSFLLLTSSSFAAQGPGKVGVVDSGKILQLMPETKRAEATLQTTVTPLRKEFERMNQELKNLVTSYEQHKSTLTKAAKAQQEKELTAKAQALQKYQQTSSGSVEKKRQELLLPIRQKIVTAIASIAQRDGFTVVVEKGSALYIAPEHDLTVKVMAQLNIK